MVELIMAMLVLAIVMTALAPAYYGLLKAAATTSQRSVANGLAVAATENIRAFPYGEIGYYPAVPAGSDCPGDPNQPVDPNANPVVLTSSTPLSLGVTTKTVGRLTYTIQSCVNWVTASIATDPSAYKQSVVTVTWTANGITGRVEQTSAIYPGGEGPYCPNQTCPASATTTTSTPLVPPSPPTNVVATDDATNPDNTIDVSWTAPPGAPNTAQYYVYYTTNNPGSGDITADGQPYTTSPLVTGTSTTITVGPNTKYYIEVATVVADDTSSPSSPVSAKTTNGPTTTTTSATTVAGSTTTTSTTLGACSINSLSVSPPPGGDSSNHKDHKSVVALTSSGNLADESSFSLSVNASGNCTNVTVGYAPTGCTPGATGCATTYAPMSGSGSTLYGTAGTSSTVWNVPSLTFIVFTGALPTKYTPLTQQNITTCTQKRTSGTC